MEVSPFSDIYTVLSISECERGFSCMSSFFWPLHCLGQKKGEKGQTIQKTKDQRRTRAPLRLGGGGWTEMFLEGNRFLLQMWHRLCYSCYNSGGKSWIIFVFVVSYTAFVLYYILVVLLWVTIQISVKICVLFICQI
jgi:hypothetical protein